MIPARIAKRLDWFLIGMLAALALAWVFPEPGATGGWLYPEYLTKIGVALIFFLHGLSLASSALKDGAKRWKLHLIVQSTTFIVFPLIAWGVMHMAGATIPADLKAGFFFLCALPSTVSSSVALTAAARGNVAAAVFNATLSSILGIFLTPLWMTLIPHDGGMLPLFDVIEDLLKWLLLPLLAGQLMRRWLADWAKRNKPLISKVDRGTILLLIYTSFCDSIQWGVWQNQDATTLLLTAVGVALLFFLILWFTRTLARLAKLEDADSIAAVFCGSKKSLAQGVPMAQLMFAGNPAIGLILLPIMLYHPLQLVICGIMAGRWAKRED